MKIRISGNCNLRLGLRKQVLIFLKRVGSAWIKNIIYIESYKMDEKLFHSDVFQYFQGGFNSSDSNETENVVRAQYSEKL